MPTTGEEAAAQATEILFDRGALMDLYIGKPTFQRKLRQKDLLLEDINEEAIYLGHKKLMPKEALERLVTLEGQARSALANRSVEFPISGARFVYYNALPDILRRLRELQEQWNAAVKQLIDDYPALRDRQLEVLDKQCENIMQKRLASLTEVDRRLESSKLLEWLDAQRVENRSLYPPVSQLPAMFHFSWRLFKVSTLQGMEEMSSLTPEELEEAQRSIRGELQQWVRTAITSAHQALGETAKQVKDLFVKQEKINPRNLRPLFEAFETFNAIDFTGNSDWRGQIEAARNRWFVKDAEGHVDFEQSSRMINNSYFAADEFKKLLDSVGSLAVEQTAREAGLAALSKVGEFKRFIEV